MDYLYLGVCDFDVILPACEIFHCPSLTGTCDYLYCTQFSGQCTNFHCVFCSPQSPCAPRLMF